MTNLKVLVIGGYGVFGGRLAELIADMAELDVWLAGRSFNKARRFCEALGPTQARFHPMKADRNDIAPAIKDIRPDIVIDATGPFQAYGDNPYGVVKACIAAGIHYADLADSSAFVDGISQFDDEAKAADICVLSGLSTCPTLTAAAVHGLSEGLDVKSVSGGIAPSPRAGLGLNVMRAILNYAGGPLELRRDGKTKVVKGLTESRRYTIRPPGHMPLRNLHFSLVDVPDLRVIPDLYPDMHDVWFGAGPVPESLHRILNLLSKTRAALRLPAFTPFAKLFHWVINKATFGEHRGGMYVEVKGDVDGAAQTRSWHLLAEGDDGPYIPSMAVEALLRKWVSGNPPKPGACSGAGTLSLEDYDAVFARHKIYTGTRSSEDETGSLFRWTLGAAYENLPDTVQALHDQTSPTSWTGSASVTRGKGLLSKVLARLFLFPKAAASIPVRVDISPDETGETWMRTFGTQVFKSRLSAGRNRNTGLIVERFGPLAFALAMVVDGGRLYFVPRSWTCLGVPMPRFMLPGGDSFECEIDGRFNYDVTIKAPLAGLIVNYEGWLERVETQ